MISGHGYDSAKVMLVADGASEEDVASGLAISGWVENVYGNFCKAHDISFNETWRTALIKERIDLRHPDKNENLVTIAYQNVLYDEINTIKPNVIVPLSELSFTYLTGLKGIRKFRGSVLPIVPSLADKPIRIIPTLGQHPYLNEDPSLLFITRLDFGKVKKNMEETGLIEDIGTVWIAKDADSLRNYFHRQYGKSDYLVFDIETYFGIPTCISFCFDGKESCTVPLIDNKLNFDSRALMFHEVIKLLASPIPKVNQNIKFDWRKLERYGIKVNNIVGDTMIAASTLYPEFPKNLGFLTSIYTDMPYFKDEGKQFDPQHHDRSRLYLYCAKDSLSTHIIYGIQQKEMEEVGVRPVYDNLMKVFPVYKKMEDRGIAIDAEKQSDLVAKYTSLFNIEKYKYQLLINGNEDCNPLSDKQVRNIVYEELRYKKIRGVKTTKSGAPGTDEESLELLMWMGEYSSIKDGKEILQTVINCRKLHKVLEYLVSPLHPDGRARCEFNLAGAETGRSTTGKTTDNLLLFKKGSIKSVDLGRSFQNIGKHGFEINGVTLGRELRSMFVPSPGFVFVENDMSQAEARVDAILAEDYEILAVFDGPIGIHKLTGSWVFNCEPKDIQKNVLVGGVDRYHLAKTIRHAGERAMKEDRLMMMIHLQRKKCKEILETFHAKQPNIREIFHKGIYNQIQKYRCLVAPNGRRRDFFGRFDVHTVNEGISFIPQAVVADQMKKAIGTCLVDNHFEDFVHPLAEAHDGFLVECPKDRKEEYATNFKKCIEVPINFSRCSLSRDFDLVIPMESEWSETNWQEMKKLKY